jgi:hypothetical protein
MEIIKLVLATLPAMIQGLFFISYVKLCIRFVFCQWNRLILSALCWSSLQIHNGNAAGWWTIMLAKTMTLFATFLIFLSSLVTTRFWNKAQILLVHAFQNILNYVNLQAYLYLKQRERLSVYSGLTLWSSVANMRTTCFNLTYVCRFRVILRLNIII